MQDKTIMIPKKLLAKEIVAGISELIVTSHLVVHEADENKKALLKEGMAQTGLKLVHQIYEAVR